MQNLIKRLEKRGWEKKEISNALAIIKKAKDSKPAHVQFLEKRIYWVLLAVIIASNFAVSVALMPLMIALKGAFLYFVVVIIGAVFGLLFELVIRSMEHLEKAHHIFLVAMIPSAALINFLIMVGISNSMTLMLNLKNAQNAAAISLAYAVSFVMPYIIYRFVLKIEYYSRG